MQSLASVTLPANWNVSFRSGMESFDEMLGNCGGVSGIRPGKICLFSAQGGTGKTRLCEKLGELITTLDENTRTEAREKAKLHKKKYEETEPIRYGHFTGEQSVTALVAMGETMKINFNDNMLADTEMYWPSIEHAIIAEKLKVVVIDSFPMLTFPLNFETKKQMTLKEKMAMIINFATEHQVAIIMINHTDKNGKRAGRNELHHLCDISFTMHVVNDGKRYNGMKVVEFRCEKNREGEPISRAFPFNGIWDLDCPLPIEGQSENVSGAENVSKIVLRKQAQKEEIFEIIAREGKLEKSAIETGAVSISGLAPSTLLVFLRTMSDAGELTPVLEKFQIGKRGKRGVEAWTMPQAKETVEQAA